MSFNDEGVLRPAICLDVETAPIDGVTAYLDEPTAPSNYVKQDAIDRYVAKAKEEQVSKCSLDPDLARIVCIGIQQEGRYAQTFTCPTAADEELAIRNLWALIEPYPYPRIIGHALVGFDIPMLLRRSLYLNVKAPMFRLGKYENQHPGLDDLMLELSFYGAEKWRGLDFYVKRFGLDVPADPFTGADIGKLVAEGRYDEVADHCASDVAKTVALAQRLGKFKV